ncbi:MAG: MarC family protein [Pseudomonadota bacterium]
MIDVFFQNLILAFVAIDPISLIPIFASLTAGMHKHEIHHIVVVSTVVSLVVLVLFGLVGSSLLHFLQIDLASFRIAGGLFLFAVGFEMVFSKRAERKRDAADKARDEQVISSLAVFPVAIPLIAGPATIAMVILVSGDWLQNPVQIWTGLLPVLLVAASTVLSMLVASVIVRHIGTLASMVAQRVFGIFLAALAVQFIIDGIRELSAM